MKIAIIGCGKIGSMFALKWAKNHSLYLVDTNVYKVEKLHETISDRFHSLEEADLIFLSIKPQDFNEITFQSKPGQIIVSALAGIKQIALKQRFPSSATFRIMPNLACQFGQGLIGVVRNDENEVDKKKVMDLLQDFGLVEWIPEEKMNAFSSLAGSGPAFVSIGIEAAIEAAIAMGLSAEEAKLLILQMILGTVVLLKETGKHPAELKWEVASPGGITIEGIRELEKHGFRSAIHNAFLSTLRRANEF